MNEAIHDFVKRFQEARLAQNRVAKLLGSLEMSPAIALFPVMALPSLNDIHETTGANPGWPRKLVPPVELVEFLRQAVEDDPCFRRESLTSSAVINRLPWPANLIPPVTALEVCAWGPSWRLAAQAQTRPRSKQITAQAPRSGTQTNPAVRPGKVCRR